MFSILKKTRALNLPYDLQIDLFNKTIKPILLYACEIWGTGKYETLERIQLKYYKLIFNLKKSTPSHMIYGELGATPLENDIKSRLISYWCRLTDQNSNKLSNNLYTIIKSLHDKNILHSKFVESIKNLINTNGFGNIWENQNEFNKNWFKKAFKQKIHDQFLQHWRATIENSTGSSSYRLFKNKFEINNYFNIISNHASKILTSFRTRNHRLIIETARWRNIPVNERKCMLCQQNDIGDEYHYLLKCEHFSEQRKQFIKKYYYNKPNTIKFNQLMNLKNKTELIKLSKFIEILMKEART